MANALEDIEEKQEPTETFRTNEEKEGGLNHEQAQEIQHLLNKAVENGVVCPRDIARVYQKIEGFSDTETERASELVERWLSVKQKHQEDFQNKTEEALKKGLITKEEKEERDKTYQEMTGEERKKEEETGFQEWINTKEQEKKEYVVLLQESPHFVDKQGRLTKKGEEKIKQYQELDEGERGKEKKIMIKRLETLDIYTDICVQNYNTARAQYNQGNFQLALGLMERNQRICQRCPESFRLQEYKTWAMSDIHNLGYEQQKLKSIQQAMEDIHDSGKAKDRQSLLSASGNAVELVNRWVSTTYDGKQGAWQGGKPEKPRSEQWKSPFMLDLQQRIVTNDQKLKKADQVLRKKEEEKKKKEAEQRTTIDKETAKSAKTQVYIEAGIQMAGRLAHHDERAEPQHIFPSVIVKQDEVNDLTTEQMEQSTVQVSLDQEKPQLREEQARETIRQKTGLEFTSKTKKLDSSGKIEKETERMIIEHQTALVENLYREGKITKNVYEEETAKLELRKMATASFAKDAVKRHLQGKDIVKQGEPEETTRRLLELFGAQRKQAPVRQKTAEEKRKEEGRKKKELLKAAGL